MMTRYCRPAGLLLLLYESTIMLTLSGREGGGVSARREYLRVIMGQDGRISGRGRKRDGGHMKPSGLRVSGLWSWWNSCTQAACVSTPAAPQRWCLCGKSWKFTGEMFCEWEGAGVSLCEESGVFSASQPPVLKVEGNSLRKRG